MDFPSIRITSFDNLPDRFSNLLTNMTDKNLLKGAITKINANLINLTTDESSV